MTIERVLVVGAAGNLGRHMVAALQQEGKQVSILVRSALTTSPEHRERIVQFAGAGASVIEGDLADGDALARAVSGVDAIISCVDQRPDALRAQLTLLEAATRAGTVQRIVPSQFGIDSRNYGAGRVGHGDVKRELQARFTASGIPVTYIHANGFATFWVASLGQLGLRRPPEREVKVFGRGDVPAAMVLPEDVARYTVCALDDARAADRHIAITPPENTYTQDGLISLWESIAGVVLQRNVVSPQELDEQIASLDRPDSRQTLALLQLIRAVWIDGLTLRRAHDVLEATELWPEVRYRRVAEYLCTFKDS